MSASSVREFSHLWTGNLGHYRSHTNNEHLEALITESLRYTGLHLENDLENSSYWSKAPLARRVALLLYLVDRGIVSRVSRHGRTSFVTSADASSWVVTQPALLDYIVPTLEFLAAIQADGVRRANRSTH